MPATRAHREEHVRSPCGRLAHGSAGHRGRGWRCPFCRRRRPNRWVREGGESKEAGESVKCEASRAEAHLGSPGAESGEEHEAKTAREWPGKCAERYSEESPGRPRAVWRSRLQEPSAAHGQVETRTPWWDGPDTDALGKSAPVRAGLPTGGQHGPLVSAAGPSGRKRSLVPILYRTQ